MKFAYRDNTGKITECNNLGEAVAILGDAQNGMLCK